MTALLIGLGIACGILLCLLLLQVHETKNICRQLTEIKGKDTNGLLHSSGSGRQSQRLIDEINSLLRKIREDGILYQRKRHDLEQMMTNISHDLRTPLTSAMGYIRLIQSSPDLSDEEQRRELDIIEKRLVRMEELINSFFEFYHIISSGEAPQKEQINVVAALESSIAGYYDDYNAKDKRIVFHCKPSRLTVSSNSSMLRRVFDNIISNSLRHGIGDLTISVNDTSDSVMIRFENMISGENIDVSRIFDEFYTTDISRTGGNTGLGLAIAKQFTVILGGRIYAESSDHIFAMTVELPII